MISLKTVKCLNCNTEYETNFIKFRVSLLTRTYEKCPYCGKLGLHKIVYKSIADVRRENNRQQLK
ncbi:MAG: hypothetical protein WCA84_05665 [Ignavibacteriaceae bacterium]